MTEKQKYAIKFAIDTMDKYNSRHWNTRYGSVKTGVTVWYGEAISILSDMVRDNDNKPTNADRIRNMSDEELAEFIQKMESTCFVDCIRYADKDCGQGKISCKDCRAKAPTILEWLQSETEQEGEQ